jgi:hypothetical protein
MQKSFKKCSYNKSALAEKRGCEMCYFFFLFKNVLFLLEQG